VKPSKTVPSSITEDRLENGPAVTPDTPGSVSRPGEKQNEFGFIVSRRPYFLVVDNWERPFALPPISFLANFRIADQPQLRFTNAKDGIQDQVTQLDYGS
jgi:hypothetical protein